MSDRQATFKSDEHAVLILASEDYSGLFEVPGDLTAVRRDTLPGLVERGRAVIRSFVRDGLIELVRRDERNYGIDPIAADEIEDVLMDDRNWDPSLPLSDVSICFTITEEGNRYLKTFY